MSKHNTLLVVGSGPGIGRNMAATFAAHGFSHVILLSRNQSRLQEDVKFVKQAASSATVDTVAVDLSDYSSVRKAIAELDKKLEASKVPLEAVLYNAARVGESKIGEFKTEDFEKDMKIAVTSMYEFASWALPKLESAASSGRAAFLVTSGLLWTDPFPHLFSLSASKAAQHNLVHSMWKQYTPKDVHCVALVVGGFVQDEAEVTSARNIAQEFWRIYSQDRKDWTADVTIKDPTYEATMRQRQIDAGMAVD